MDHSRGDDVPREIVLEGIERVEGVQRASPGAAPSESKSLLMGGRSIGAPLRKAISC